MSNALNSVYNHYLSAYAPPSVTKYDSHKKSELRGVYNSIVKINRESPWYLPPKGSDVQSFAIGLKENARELHNAIAAMGGVQDSESGLLSKKTASSSNNSIVSALFIGDASEFDEPPSFTMDVRALAQSQENMGEFLPKGQVKLPADTYSFDVQINDMNYEFQFSISDGETNEDVQNRLARLINNSNIGLQAEVQEQDQKTSLVISSEATGMPQGKDSIFTISDDHTSKSRGAVDYLGLNYISREPSNSDILVNGTPYSTASNEFTVGKMFEVSVNSTTPEGQPVTISLKTDVESLTDNITGLMEGYNQFIRNTSSHFEEQPRSKHLLREFNSIASYYSKSFERIGISRQEDGTLSLDTSKLSDAILSSDDLSDTFSPLKDFSQRVLRKSDEVAINPMTYVDRKVVAYKNPGGPNFNSPYITSAYSGMMFNGYC